MDQRKNEYQKQVDYVVNHPDVPEHVKVMFQNLAGALYHQGTISEITLKSNQAGTLSPFANLDGKVILDNSKEQKS
jgi:hypothetical protein